MYIYTDFNLIFCPQNCDFLCTNIDIVDFRMKRTSPTAYCDCWEKCKCKALIAGQQAPRYDLLNKLLAETDLVTLPNSRYTLFVI